MPRGIKGSGPKAAKVIVPPKTLASNLSPKERAMIRLQCLKLVIEGGSRIDSNKPEEKAQQYYDFIMDGQTSNIKVVNVKQQVQINKEPSKDTPKNPLAQPIAPTAHPFGESGRKQVLLS